MGNKSKKKTFSLAGTFKTKGKNKPKGEPAQRGNTVSKPANEEQSRFQIVNGTRKRNKKMRIIFYCIIGVVIVALLITHFLLPTGLLEGIQNGYSALGSGDFPVSFYAANPTDYVKYGNISCTLNQTYFEVYNEKGKLIQAVSHGLSNPKLEVSESRFLLFDRDRYSVKIFKYSTELHTAQFKNTIISADIGRDGTYAVVTNADSYLATVYVYNKNNDLIFTWNSANNYITDVAVLNNGKSIAVSYFNAQNGSFKSTVGIFDFKSDSPNVKYEIDGLVSALKSVNNNYIIAHGVDFAKVIPWNGGSVTDLSVNGVIRHTDIADNGQSAVVYGREYNETNNSVSIIGKSGKSIAQFDFNAIINDVSLSDESILILSNEKIYRVDYSGNILSETVLEIKPLHIGAVNNKECLAFDNSKMNRIKLS